MQHLLFSELLLLLFPSAVIIQLDFFSPFSFFLFQLDIYLFILDSNKKKCSFMDLWTDFYESYVRGCLLFSGRKRRRKKKDGGRGEGGKVREMKPLLCWILRFDWLANDPSPMTQRMSVWNWFIIGSIQTFSDSDHFPEPIPADILPFPTIMTRRWIAIKWASVYVCVCVFMDDTLEPGGFG